MSRCFPFPPPGYERKHRPEDLDILKEAKRKEKKHRKEKKDKERKKDREKKKDENDEKPRDKKDRKGKHKDKKEKHKDKKKDKEDRSKDKDKSSISEESTVSGKLEKSGEKLHPKGYSKDQNSVVDEGKHFASFQGQNGEKASQSSLPPPQRTEESKFVQELDRRIRDDQRRGSKLPERVEAVDKRDQEMATRISGVLADEKGNNGKVDLKRLENESSGNASVNNLTPIAKSKYEGILRPLDGQNDKNMGGKEKHKETGDSKLAEKRRDRDQKSHGKEKDKDKEKKKEEKAKMKIENKKNKQEKSKEVGRDDLVSVTSNKTYKSDLSKDVMSNAEVNVRKRKDTDTDTNGYLHDSETRPNKMQRLAHHEPTENGRKFQAFQTPSNSSYDNHAVPKPARLDNNDRLINGTIKSQNPSPSKPNLSSAATMVRDQVAEVPKIFHRESISLNKKPILPKIDDQIAEPSKRLPHPDSKYLQEVLTVPVVGDWPGNDDQEWLFSKKGSSVKTKSVGVEEEQCVWSKAVYIEPIDVCALPYVIPY